MRPLFLAPHPDLRSWTGNDNASVTGQEYSGASPASQANAAGKNSSGGAERCVMNLLGNPPCAICGRDNSANQPRFLIAENSWEDKLTILQWNESMASRPGFKAACSIEHVEELVIHWMTTGRLDYPFARASYGTGGWRHASPLSRSDLSGARSIGELAVHRESLERVLMENPQSLQVILDAMTCVRRSRSKRNRFHCERRNEKKKKSCVRSPPNRDSSGGPKHFRTRLIFSRSASLF